MNPFEVSWAILKGKEDVECHRCNGEEKKKESMCKGGCD